jgi:hypothetical protein
VEKFQLLAIAKEQYKKGFIGYVAVEVDAHGL